MGGTRALVTHRWPDGSITYINSHSDANTFVLGMLDVLRASKAASPSAPAAEVQAPVSEELQNRIDKVSTQLIIEDACEAPLRQIVQDLRRLLREANDSKHVFEKGRLKRTMDKDKMNKDIEASATIDNDSSSPSHADSGTCDGNSSNVEAGDPIDNPKSEDKAALSLDTVKANIQYFERAHSETNLPAFALEVQKHQEAVTHSLDNVKAKILSFEQQLTDTIDNVTKIQDGQKRQETALDNTKAKVQTMEQQSAVTNDKVGLKIQTFEQQLADTMDNVAKIQDAQKRQEEGEEMLDSMKTNIQTIEHQSADTIDKMELIQSIGQYATDTIDSVEKIMSSMPCLADLPVTVDNVKATIRDIHTLIGQKSPPTSIDNVKATTVDSPQPLSMAATSSPASPACTPSTTTAAQMSLRADLEEGARFSAMDGLPIELLDFGGKIRTTSGYDIAVKNIMKRGKQQIVVFRDAGCEPQRDGRGQPVFGRLTNPCREFRIVVVP